MERSVETVQTAVGAGAIERSQIDVGLAATVVDETRERRRVLPIAGEVLDEHALWIQRLVAPFEQIFLHAILAIFSMSNKVVFFALVNEKTCFFFLFFAYRLRLRLVEFESEESASKSDRESASSFVRRYLFSRNQNRQRIGL